MRSSLRPTNRAAAYRLWRRWLGPAVLTAAVSAAGGAHADDSFLTWIIKTVSYDEDGDVIRASAMRVPQDGTPLAVGQQISTGAGQHMILVNGRDLVEIKPNSTITIGDDDASTATANVNLVNGEIHVEVGKRAPGKTFSIDAPYLVATVKGTQFNVTSSSEASEVRVTEGVVAVSADTTGASIDVTVGNTAIVGRRNADQPMLASSPASRTPNTIKVDENNIESASTDNGGAGGSNSGGSNSGGSNSGGSNSGGSNSGGSNSGGSDSDSGGSDSGSGGSDSGSGGSDSGSGGGLGGAVGDAADAVGGAVGGAADAVGGAVSGATGALGDAVGGPVGGAVSGVGGAVGGAVSGVGGAVGGAVGGVGGAVGGLLGGGGK